MSIRLHPKTKTSQRQVFRQIVVAGIAVSFICALFLLITQQFHSEKAYAETCEFSYMLDWSDTTTWDVDCGEVNAANWNVKGKSCWYFSPIFNVPGVIGGPARLADIVVRINQSGNLDGNDTAYVYLYVNGIIQNTYKYMGDSIKKVFITTKTVIVPAGGTYSVRIQLKNDKANELWQIKNGDVTTCLRAINPLPITLTDFKAEVTADQKVALNWITETEVNNDYFTIQRSANGSTFEDLAQVNGSGTTISSRNYYYTDNNPLSGRSYYRLKQTDYDGTSSTFSIVTVNIRSQGNGNPKVMKVLPNPFDDHVMIEFYSEQSQRVIVQMISMSGAILMDTTALAEEGQNRIRFQIPQGIRPGLYGFRVLDDEKVIASAKAIHR